MTKHAPLSIPFLASLVLLVIGCEPEPVSAAETRQDQAAHLTQTGMDTLQDGGAAADPQDGRRTQDPQRGQEARPQGGEAQDAAARSPRIAVCILRPVGDSKVEGTIEIRSDGQRVHLGGTVRGLTPGEHGFHVHEFGDLRAQQDGKSAGGHFAPRGNPHGRPADEKRHVGDLGNVEANEQGVATIDITDDVIALEGPHSILGRSIVVHAKADTFGQPSGDAGDRVAFGVIGIAGAR